MLTSYSFSSSIYRGVFIIFESPGSRRSCR
jgi:hypothetical protein